MGAPFTQDEIQAEIDFYKDAMRTAATSQEYSYDQGAAGQFGVKKGKLDELQEALQYWLDLMDQYYPSAFTEEPNITFTEIGVLSG